MTENITRSAPMTVSGELTQLAAIITTVGFVTVPLFALFGIVGNIFTLLIMHQQCFRKSSTSVHLSALAISDTMYNFVNPFTKSFVKDIFRQDPKTLSDAGCKVFFSMLRNAKIISSWIVVLICLERFLVIWFPLRVRQLYTRNVSVVAVTSVAVICITFNTVWSIQVSGIVGQICLPSVMAYNPEVVTAFLVAGTAVYNIIPTVILLLLTPLTILKLFRHMSWRRGIHTTTGNVDSIRVTRMTIAVTVAYIILVTPISTAHSVAFFQNDNIFESTDPSFIIFREFAQTLEQFNYCINFFLYVIFNASFRRTLCGLLGCRRENSQRATNRQEAHALGNKSSESVTDTPTTTNSASFLSV